MIKKLYLIAAVFLFLTTPKLFAQDYKQIKEVARGTVNFMELVEYEKKHPELLTRKPPRKEIDEELNLKTPPEADPSLVRFLQKTSAYKPVSGSGFTASIPASSTPTDTFQGVLSGGSNIPPDTHGGVDSSYIVNATNSAIKIQNRLATCGTTPCTVGTPVSLDGFWGGTVLGSGNSSFDPRVHYDPYAKRWIIVAVATNGAFTSARILVAVSATGNPTGTWYKTSYNVYASSNWLDFPNVGFNGKWIAVTGNYFSAGGSYSSSAIWVFNKASLYANTATSPTQISLGGSFTTCPAQTYDANEGSLFLLNIYNRAATTGGQLQLRKITGAAGSPVLSSTLGFPSAGSLPSTVKKWAQGAASGANFAPQSGSTQKIQNNDDRINNVVFRNGKIWTTHTVFYPATSSPTHSSVMWWQMDSTGAPLKVGLIDDESATNTKFYAFPSISVNAQDDALVGFSAFASNMYPVAAYALRLHTDPDTMRTPYYYRHGQKYYYQTFGGSENRWGDYSQTCVDPRNDNDFWTVQEAVPSWGSTCIWDTWWARVQICPTPSTPVLSTSPASLCAGATDVYGISPITGATAYTWAVTGTGWGPAAGSGTSISITAGTGPGVVSVYADNSCGSGSVLTFTITPATVPPAPTVSTVTPPCVGSPTAVFTGAATGASSYSWTATGSGWGGSATTSSFTAAVGVGTGTITVSALNACGMGPVTTYTVDPGTPPGAATAITAPTLLCSGQTATFSTPAVTGATSYTWTVTGTGWSGTSTTATFTPTVGTTAATIIVTPVNACGNGTPDTFTTAAPTITPSATYSVTAHVTFRNVPVTVTYTGTAPAGATYTWNFGGGTATPGTGAGPHSVVWTTSGTKTVTVTVSYGGCTSGLASDTVKVKTPVGLPAISIKQLEFNVVPNPNNGTFDLVFSQAISKDISVRLLDIQGKTVYTKKFALANTDKISIETDNLAAGTYIANVQIETAVLTQKITITK